MTRTQSICGVTVLGCFLWAFGSTGVEATTRTFTGADIFNDPTVSFPTTTPIVDGSSLVFGTGTTIHEKLFVLPLLPAGSLTGSTPETISISINLTRLTNDWDPHLLLGDGSNLFGAVIADNGGGEFLGTTLVDSVNVGTRVVLSSVFTGAGFPGIDNSFDITAEFTLQTGLSTVDVAFGTGSGSFSVRSGALDPTSALDFVFMSDNDIGEQYQINSLTVTTPGFLFADFTLKQANIKFGTHTGSLDDVHLQGHVTLDEVSNGIDLMNEKVVVVVGTSSLVFPAGSFIPVGSKFNFAGNVGMAVVTMRIAEKSGEAKFSLMAKGVDLSDTSNPVSVRVQIGDDGGGTSVRLKGVLNLGGGKRDR